MDYNGYVDMVADLLDPELEEMHQNLKNQVINLRNFGTENPYNVPFDKQLAIVRREWRRRGKATSPIQRRQDNSEIIIPRSNVNR